MRVPAPHFLLFSEARQESPTQRHPSGQWRFVLESVDGEEKLEAIDSEPEVRGDRLELLAVVRGLEALDQPSKVTLITRSRYVSRGLRFGLSEWRETGWKWEHFGELEPVKNDDLWRRIDHAMNFHQVECRTWRFDSAHADSNNTPKEPSRDPNAAHEGHNDTDARIRGKNDKPADMARTVVGKLKGLLRRKSKGRSLQTH